MWVSWRPGHEVLSCQIYWALGSRRALFHCCGFCSLGALQHSSIAHDVHYHSFTSRSEIDGHCKLQIANWFDFDKSVGPTESCCQLGNFK